MKKKHDNFEVDCTPKIEDVCLNKTINSKITFPGLRFINASCPLLIIYTGFLASSSHPI